MKTTNNKSASAKPTVAKKAKLEVVWPTTEFTINDLQTAYPNAVNITLRFRVNRALEQGQIVRVGHKTGDVGRPTLVFSKANPTKELLAKVKAAGVILEEQYEKMLTPAVQIKDTPSVPASAVVPTAPTVPSTKKTVTA